jgi:hypothetical protein
MYNKVQGGSFFLCKEGTMKRMILVLVLFLAFSLVTTQAAQAQEVWSLVSTEVNPNNERTEFYGGGTTPYWYTEPRYEGKLQVYTLTSTSFSVHDVEMDHGYQYYDVILTTNFQSPPSQLTPGQTVNLTANFSHSGVVDSYPPGVRFWYSSDHVSMTPTTAFGYFPWHDNFSGISSTTYSFVVPNTHSGEIKIYASWWNVPCALLVWTYQASGTAPGNTDPQLSMASLTPTTGTSETEFTFSVNYYDADGDSPYVRWVNINDRNFDMDLTSGSADNGTYSIVLYNFPTGTNSYYFYFEDPSGGSARLPTTGSYSGPTIFQSPQPCPIEQITQDNMALDPLREFRYRVLSRSERGREYVNLYYQHARETALILIRKPEARRQARSVLQEAVPEIRLILRGEKNELSPALKEQISSFLDEFESYTSDGLMDSISRVREDIETGIIEELVADMDFSPRPSR